MSAVSVLDGPMIDAVCAALRRTLYLETAASLAGVHRTTLWRWMQRGTRAARAAARSSSPVPEADAPYARLAAEVSRVLAEEEALDLEIIKGAAGDGVWQAAAWRRERHDPERWGSHRHEIALLKKELAELRKLVEARQGGR